MKKDLSYFFPGASVAKRESFGIVVSDRFKDEEGNLIEWEFKYLTADELKEIKQDAMKSYTQHGRKTYNFDSAKMTEDVILSSLIYPNLKDVNLQEAYGAMTDKELLKMMLEGREYEKLETRVLREQGLVDDYDVMIAEAKN